MGILKNIIDNYDTWATVPPMVQECNEMGTFSWLPRYFSAAIHIPVNSSPKPTSEEYTIIKNHRMAVMIYGRLCYRDIFQDEHWTRFCMFWKENNGKLTDAEYCQHGNDTDDVPYKK